MCTQNVDPINETPKEKYLDRYGREVGDFIKKIVTGDESWVHHYDPESKAQSLEYRHKTSPKPKNSDRFCTPKVMTSSIM